MSGNLWMFSDKLDDEDIEIMKHEFITYYQGADYYGLGLKMFTRLAHEAGAVYKIGNGEDLYSVLYTTYLDPVERKHEEILKELRMTSRTYYRLRREAITIMSIRLWSAPSGETASWLEVLTILEEM